MADLHSDFPVYLEDPKPYLPEKTSRKGREFNRYQSDASSLEVKAAVEGLKVCGQPLLKLRDTTRGSLRIRALCFPVYLGFSLCKHAKSREPLIHGRLAH